MLLNMQFSISSSTFLRKYIFQVLKYCMTQGQVPPSFMQSEIPVSKKTKIICILDEIYCRESYLKINVLKK